MFITLLNCFDYQFGALNEKTFSRAVEIAELDSDLTHARSQIRKLQSSVSLGKQRIDNHQETSRENMFLLQDRLKDTNELNSKIFSLNSQHSLETERVIRLNERISLLQEENTLLLSRAIKAEKEREKSWTTEYREKANGIRAVEDIDGTSLIDAECFPSDFHRISFINSLLSGKAWDAVHDGVKRMNSNPLNPNSWLWNTPASLW
ncbi:hypothetical protein HI914_04898 [Erysiphe necator]|nr:hypothetical protein HI914_04898 [Erysiphe necator]